MNTSNQQKIYYVLGAIIVILAIIWVVVASTNKAAAPMSSESASTTSMSNDSLSGASSTMTSAVTALSTSTKPTMFAFSLQLASSTYSQNDIIPMQLAIMNITNVPQTLHFTDGCQAVYNIGSFNQLAHTDCQPNPTMITIAPHEVSVFTMVHYPSVYKIPPGTYTLTGNVIGYGGTTAKVTITR